MRSYHCEAGEAQAVPKAKAKVKAKAKPATPVETPRKDLVAVEEKDDDDDEPLCKKARTGEAGRNTQTESDVEMTRQLEACLDEMEEELDGAQKDAKEAVTASTQDLGENGMDADEEAEEEAQQDDEEEADTQETTTPGKKPKQGKVAKSQGCEVIAELEHATLVLEEETLRLQKTGKRKTFPKASQLLRDSGRFAFKAPKNEDDPVLSFSFSKHTKAGLWMMVIMW